MRGRALATLAWLATASCASRGAKTPAAPSIATPEVDTRAAVAQLVASEDRALDWLAAADPRLAARLGSKASEAVLSQVGTEAVLAEDSSAAIHDGALDLFGFRARALAIDHAAKDSAQVPTGLPAYTTDTTSPVARPALEAQLLARLVAEETARVADEAKLGARSSDLVRGMLDTWKAPAGDDAWRARDAWAARHLSEIADSLRADPSPAGPLDLDESLYPLERLLAPLEFPKASAALARVRTALDSAHGAPALWPPESIARTAKTYLGADVDPRTLAARLAGILDRLRRTALAALTDAAEGRAALEGHARDLLFAEGRCPAVSGSRLRAAAPPPERAAVCGLLSALADAHAGGAAVVALHDDVSLALAAIDPAPPPRTALLSRPDDDRVDTLRRLARQRPVVAVGLLLAAYVLYADPAATDERLRAWVSLGEAPLDLVAREVGAPLP